MGKGNFSEQNLAYSFKLIQTKYFNIFGKGGGGKLAVRWLLTNNKESFVMNLERQE